MWKNVKEVKPKQIEGKQTYLNIIKINFKSCSFVVRFFAFCGLTMCDIKTCNKINVVGLEILNILVYHKMFLRRNFFFDGFLAVSVIFLCFIGLSYFLTFLLSSSSLTGLSCFMKVKRKMQFILCFLKCASKSLRSQSLNFLLPNNLSLTITIPLKFTATTQQHH